MFSITQESLSGLVQIKTLVRKLSVLSPLKSTQSLYCLGGSADEGFLTFFTTSSGATVSVIDLASRYPYSHLNYSSHPQVKACIHKI